MCKVALVFPYFRTRTPTEMLFPPLGPAALVAQLRERGVQARVFDCTFSSFAQLRQDLRSYRPDIVGISSMVSLTENTMRVADMVRKILPQALLVAGGPLPTVFPARYSKRFDAVFRGEADVSFPRFCRDYFERGITRERLAALPLATYDGLYVGNAHLQVSNPPVHYLESDLAHFPLPDRSDVDHHAYQEEWLRKEGTKTTSLIATFGCPFDCEFCSKPIFGNIVRRRALDTVFAEIEQLRALGYDSLWIADDIFTLDRPYLEEFCRRIAGMGMSWTCLSRANGITAATIRLMKQAGCRRVYLGLESGSDATLALMHKQVTVAQGIRTARLYQSEGVGVAAFFIVGYPGETVDSIEATFRLALSLPLDEISFNVPMPLPGSDLFDRLGGPDEGRDWAEENEVTFVYRSEIDERWLRRRVAETMSAFARRQQAGAQLASAAGGRARPSASRKVREPGAPIVPAASASRTERAP
jgi:anaerobic magnesium-protoporphyrin IX monomethyl ester cyclase